MVDEFNKEMCDREHTHLNDELGRIEKDMNKKYAKLELIVDKIRDRISPTTAAVLMVMASIIGALVTALGYALKH